MGVRSRYRAAGVTLTGAALFALFAGPASGQVWTGGSPEGYLSEAGDGTDDGDEPVDGAGGPAQTPAAELAECDWAREPLPDSELDIPDPEDYLVPQEDGSNLLPSETVEVNGHEVSLPLLQDLMTVAEQKGISVEEAIFRHGWQEQFGQVATELEDAYPDEIAESRIVDDGCGARIAFKGPVPALATELTGSLPVPVELVGDRGYARAELVEIMHEVYLPIAEHPDVATAGGSPDGATGVVSIRVQPRGDTTPTDRDALCAELAPAPPANPAITIQLTLVEDIQAPASRTHPC